MFWSRKPDKDPTLTELLTRIIELENEWRAFLTQQSRYAARMAKRARDDMLASHRAIQPDAGQAGQAAGKKADLWRRARARGIGAVTPPPEEKSS